MNMSLQHNLAALNASGQFRVTTDKRSKTTEKLSSGYRVNRAADDAAGLAISEKMRRQIKGLNQASKNIQDGISLCQVADGALAESQDILQRMNVLAVQAANGTNSEQDRSYLQQEVSQLVNEIDRIANNTTFNEQIYPLKMDVASETSGISLGSVPLKEAVITEINGSPEPYKTTVDGVDYRHGEQYSYHGLYLDNGACTTILLKDEAVQYSSMYFMNNAMNNVRSLMGADDRTINSLSLSDLRINDEGYIVTTGEYGVDMGIYYLTDDDDNIKSMGFSILVSPFRNYLKVENIDTEEENIQQSPIKIQSGVESGQYIELELCNATAANLGIIGVDVSTANNAGLAIDKIKSALNKVSEFRSDFGAQQNRLEHAYNIDQNTAENTQYAESQIRDTDMATTMMEHSNLGILEQAGTSMLSQANQSRQNLLSLLQ